MNLLLTCPNAGMPVGIALLWQFLTSRSAIRRLTWPGFSSLIYALSHSTSPSCLLFACIISRLSHIIHLHPEMPKQDIMPLSSLPAPPSGYESLPCTEDVPVMLEKRPFPGCIYLFSSWYCHYCDHGGEVLIKTGTHHFINGVITTKKCSSCATSEMNCLICPIKMLRFLSC